MISEMIMGNGRISFILRYVNTETTKATDPQKNGFQTSLIIIINGKN